MRPILFAREPRPGLVKTRLAAGIGDVPACVLYEAMLRDCAAAIAELSVPATLCYTPDSDAAWFAAAFPGILLEAQVGQDLGERMANALRGAWDAGAEGAVIFGSDSPTVPVPARRRALDALSGAPVVLAPDTGGGYWALGARRGTPLDWLAGIAWGQPTVLRQTRDHLARAGLAHQEADTWDDVDEPADLKRLADSLDRGEGFAAPHTSRYMGTVRS